MILDLTKDGPYQRLQFPDGQIHISVDSTVFAVPEVKIVCRITSPSDLLELLLAADALRSCGVQNIQAQINYLMGARMDRSIGIGHPRTLKVISDILKTAGFEKIVIVEPHSEAATLLLDATGVAPKAPLLRALIDLGRLSPVALVAPDAGATKRVEALVKEVGGDLRILQCLKKRDPYTGQLSGFRLCETAVPETCIIVDDICDGGGTFTAVAELLRAAGAQTVILCVTHGIFSKGLPIESIDRIYTTNSFQDNTKYEGPNFSTDDFSCEAV